MEERKCAICGILGSNNHGHHLSYEPEIVVFLCNRHHIIVHELDRIGPEKRDLIYYWINDFSYQWVNGTEKFLKSKYRKDWSRNYNREYNRLHRNKEREHSKRKYHIMMSDPVKHDKWKARHRVNEQHRRDRIKANVLSKP